MRRRLTLAIVAVVAGALAVAGIGSLVLVGRADTGHFRDRLYSQAHAIAANLDTLVFTRTGTARKNVLAVVAEVSRLEGVAIASVETNGQVVPIQPSAPLLGLFGRPQALPSGLTAADLDPSSLVAGRSTSGNRGSLIWVAVPASISTSSLIPAGTSADRAAALERRLTQVSSNGVLPLAVVVTGRDPGTPGANAYFALSAAAALAVAVLVGVLLTRRITRPLAAAEDTARKIAAGDLEQRIPIAPGDYDEIASLAASINTMSDSLASARTRERQFFMSISHDLRTPLTSIKGWSEAIADGAASDQRRAAEIIAAETTRLERLVQDLLDLAKLDSKGFSLQPRPVDVRGVVADTADGFRPMLEQAGLSLEVLLPPAPLEAVADPDRLAQVVANLVENAYKYAGASIRVRADRLHGAIIVTIEDDGPGIAPAERDHVFERLFQTARTPTRQAGSGLGLAIVKELTEAMGGTVGVDSAADGSGSRLSIYLRCADTG